MGAKLAIWDWMFGTLVRSEEIKKVKFGLGLKDDENYDTLTKNLYKPFSNLWQKLKKHYALPILQNRQSAAGGLAHFLNNNISNPCSGRNRGFNSRKEDKCEGTKHL